MKATVFCEITDAASFLAATRFDRASATFWITQGEPVDTVYCAARVITPALDRAQSQAAARITGVELNFDDIVEADSTDAWRLLVWAGIEDATPGGPAYPRQRKLIRQLWRAHFLEGADIADPLVLAGRAALSDLDLGAADDLLATDEFADIVESQREVAASFREQQVPLIVVDDTFTIAGLQSQDGYVQALAKILAQTRSRTRSAEPDLDDSD